MRIRATRPLRPFLALLALPAAACAPAGPGDDVVDVSSPLTVSGKVSWTQAGGDSTHRGSNASEWVITPTSVARLAPIYTLPAVPSNALVVALNRPMSGYSTLKDVAMTADSSGGVTAFDASTGELFWGNQPTSGKPVSSPTLAIDPTLTFVITAGGDGSLHKITIATGVEVTTGGWPERYLPLGYAAFELKNTPITIGVTPSGSYAYIGTGTCDLGKCVGSVTAIALSTGQQLTFNTMCSDTNWHLSAGECVLPKLGMGLASGGGVWARGGLPFDPATQRLYFATGDGPFDPANKRWGDSLLALNPNGNGVGGGKPVGSYTPGEYAHLETADLDLGSANALILPNNGTSYPHLALTSGKDQKLRFVNLDALSATGAVGGEVASVSIQPVGVDNKNQVMAPLSTWVNPADNTTWVFVSVRQDHRVIAYKLTVTSGKPGLTAAWTQPCSAATGSDARCGGVFAANGVVYYSNGVDLQARNATTGALLWTLPGISSNSGTLTPLVVNGILFVPGVNKAYGIPNGLLQRGRMNGSATIGAAEAFPYAIYGVAAGPPFDPSADQRRLNPEAYPLVLDSTTYNEIAWGMGMASRVSSWTKGSSTALVTTFWNKAAPRREIWEFDGGPGGSAIHVTANAPVFPHDQASGAFGVRRQNGRSMVVYRGTDSALHAFYWDPTALVWSYDQLETAFDDDSYIAASDPMAFKRSTGGVSILYRQANCDECVGEYRVVPSPPAIRGTTALPSPMRPFTIPVGARDNAGVAVIVATTTDGLYFLRDTGNDKTFSYSVTRVFSPLADTIDGSPSFYVRGDGLNAIVFRYEPGGAIHHLYELVQQPAGNWIATNISAAAGGEETEATIADPEAFISSDGKDTVLYRTVSQGTYKLERASSTKWVRTKLN